MDGIQSVVIPLHTSGTRSPSLGGSGSRESIRGVAVVPQSGAIPSSPKRGSSVLRNIYGGHFVAAAASRKKFEVSQRSIYSRWTASTYYHEIVGSLHMNALHPRPRPWLLAQRYLF
ncbi:hypothetical protein PC129_g20137 [Phytophthora cactorum]|uniref:Uncharacterized protein n=1 Tax=Phytophthora cactorum TaxID=29920 RepID=A0A8T1G7D0_9STRA|nr:hypothetical protein PC112_g7782 [Phytophthora cactorum]KAG2990701.1 hypothetical protein PC118_g5498 [Phytophthora cactorum]KAG3031528.1 hypothetical protein PC119_g5887 [Phytophthora cactorum]KAG3046162.1 hypothetical protein PC121_g20859 [Phytophthora cactorum]KAG3182825.1 hypothetical protein C6341_g5769 [Phytophthora cactorum]